MQYPFTPDTRDVYESASGFYSWEHEPCVPPLMICSSGVARWFGVRSYSRTLSHTFGIELVTAGNALFLQDGKRYQVDPGAVYLLRRGVAHTYRVGPAGYLHKRYVVAEGPALESILRAAGLEGCDYVKVRSRERVVGLLRTIHACLCSKPPGFAQRLSNLAYELIVELGYSLARRYPEPVQAAIDFMERNLGAAVTGEGVARAAGLSQTHFNRLFRQTLGMSAMSFYRQQKYAWARHLLLESSMSVKGIAAALGYDDPLYFSSRFRAWSGHSPRQFRRCGGAGADEGEGAQ